MSFRIASRDVDVDELVRQVRAAIAEKKRGLYTEDELREIAERPLEPVLDAHDFKSSLLAELLRDPGALELHVSLRTRCTGAAGVRRARPWKRSAGSCGPCRSCSGTPRR